MNSCSLLVLGGCAPVLPPSEPPRREHVFNPSPKTNHHAQVRGGPCPKCVPRVRTESFNINWLADR